MSGGGRKPVGDDAEVEALLRAAQDAVLLKLQANSHLVSSSSSAASNPLAHDEGPGPLDDDLARRLDALRSRPPAPKRPDAAGSAPAPGGMDEMEARFAALKGVAVCPDKETRVRLEDLGGASEEEDEVEKVMRWAMDAARLDVATAGGGVSKAEDKEEEDKISVSSEEDEEERLELEEEKKRKEMLSKKNKAKNRFKSNSLRN